MTCENGFRPIEGNCVSFCEVDGLEKCKLCNDGLFLGADSVCHEIPKIPVELIFTGMDEVWGDAKVVVVEMVDKVFGNDSQYIGVVEFQTWFEELKREQTITE